MAYTPASNITTSPSLTHLQTTHWKTRALDQLKQMFMFLEGTEKDDIPQRVGKTVQWFRYQLLGANTTPSSEGVVPTGLPLTTSTVSATVSQYSDFITLGKLLVATALDNIKANAAEQLGYRAGLTVDTITRTEFDSNVSTVGLATLGAALGSIDFRRVVTTLQANNVQPKVGSSYIGIIHPYALFDLKSDNSAGGFIDVMRYANPQGLLNAPTMNGEAGMVENCRLLKSTNVGTTGTAPNVLYYTYVIGKGAVGAVDLAGHGPTKVVDPDKQTFAINVIDGKPQIADPTGEVAAAVSYWFAYVAKTLDSTTYRYRIIRADSSII